MELTIIILLVAIIVLELINTVCTVLCTISNFAKNNALLAMGQHLDKGQKAIREDIEMLNENLDTINSNQEEIYKTIRTVETKFNYILPGTRPE
jgi:peptidoglycan hydrolase CwlO-like protein